MVWLSHSYRLSSGGLSVMTSHEERVLCLYFWNCYLNWPFEGYFFPLTSQLHLLLVHLVTFNLQFSLKLTHSKQLFSPFVHSWTSVPSLSSVVSLQLLCSFPLAHDLLKCCEHPQDTSLSDNFISYSALFGSPTEHCCVRGLHGRWIISAGKVSLSVHTSNCCVPVTVANLPW